MLPSPKELSNFSLLLASWKEVLIPSPKFSGALEAEPEVCALVCVLMGASCSRAVCWPQDRNAFHLRSPGPVSQGSFGKKADPCVKSNDF